MMRGSMLWIRMLEHWRVRVPSADDLDNLFRFYDIMKLARIFSSVSN
jgi:hypothetical protein